MVDVIATTLSVLRNSEVRSQFDKTVKQSDKSANDRLIRILGTSRNVLRELNIETGCVCARGFEV